MPILHRDYETRGTINLKKSGAWRYASHPSTDVWCCAYAVDDGPVQLWLPGDLVPPAWLEAASNPDWIVCAHNDSFERRIEQHIMGPRYGFPIIPLQRHRCTMAQALAVALPAKLENVAAALQLKNQKSDSTVMMQMAKPRRPRRGENPNVTYWFDDDGRREQLYAYCKQDVEVERELHHRVSPLLPAEQELWLLDQVICDRGFHVDRKLAEAARRVVSEEQVRINKELAELTGGAATTINQVEKIIAYIQSQGHQLAGLTKRSVSAVLAHEPSDDVREILELRRTGARASVRKLDALFDRIDADDRLRDTLQFHAAATGRWAGRGFQPQNLKKPETKDLAAAIDAVLGGILDDVRALGAPLSVTGDISRSIINAAPGYVLIGADFSAIESRVLAWCPGETWKLDAYREFDRTGDSKHEPYCVTASEILKRPVTKDDEAGRSIGKLCDLSFLYGGGLGAWRKFDSSDTYSDADVEKFKTACRRKHKATFKFWHGLERAAHRAIRTGQRTEYRMFSFAMEDGTLYMTLPSGRRLAYPEARLVPGKFEGTREICFKDNAGGRWVDSGAWYGTLVENAVQAVSRDLLAAAMQRLEAAGYPITLHVHDEIVSEVPEGSGDEKKFVDIMTALPDWAPGLPVAAKPWSGTRYAKPEKKPQNAAPDAVERVMTQPEVTKATPEPEKIVVSAQKPAEMAPWEGSSTFSTSVKKAVGSTEDASDGLPNLADLIDGVDDSGKVCCPFHNDTRPSCQIYSDHYHCFVCGAHGDRVDWLMLVKGMERGEALMHLDNWEGPVSRPTPERDDEDKTSNALQIWEKAKLIGGTLAEKYLAEVRRIDITALPNNVDEVLRFHPRCPFGSGVRLPCLLALLRDPTTDEPTGIQRIALKPDVFNGAKVERRVLGRLGAVKIWPANGCGRLVVGEGIETVLAAATRIPYKGEPLRPAWSAISAGRLGAFPVITGVERLIILVDHDKSGAGQTAAATCASRWSHAGRTVVELMRNRPGDFNDIILEKDYVR
jgi:Toprim domain-containing protein/CHC2-type zinc finger protein